MSTDQTAAALSGALRAFGESLGRALAEGIARGVQEGLSQSLDLERLVEGASASASAPARAVRTPSSPAPRRGGRPRGEARPCSVSGCQDPARSRGLCSRHYQQELRREKMQMAAAISHGGGSVSARPPIVRRKPEPQELHTMASLPTENRAAQEPAPKAARGDEPRTSPLDAAKRIFG